MILSSAKFVQIAVAKFPSENVTDVYALDENGNVWNYYWGDEKAAEWRNLSTKRAELPMQGFSR